MTRSVPTLAVACALLGVVAWMAIAHPAAGSLYAPSAARVDASADSRPAQSAPAHRLG